MSLGIGIFMLPNYTKDFGLLISGFIILIGAIINY